MSGQEVGLISSQFPLQISRGRSGLVRSSSKPDMISQNLWLEESFSGDVLLEVVHHSRYFGKRLNFPYVSGTDYPANESFDSYSCASRWL
jgi:hypothetical protein